MESRELIQLAIAIVVIGLIVIVLRRASKRSRERAPASVKERLGVEPAPRPGRVGYEEDEARERKAREDKATEAAHVEVPADAETAAAYKAGLAKTRGGFVAKL